MLRRQGIGPVEDARLKVYVILDDQARRRLPLGDASPRRAMAEQHRDFSIDQRKRIPRSPS